MSVTTTTQSVSFLDLAALHAPIRDQLDAAWAETLAHSSFIGGPHVESFEQRWAAYCEREHCVGVANGTDALELVLASLGVGPGDEVIVPANTFVATAEAVVTAGATPVFVDVDPDSLLITAATVEAALSARTKAVMVVHLYGQVAAMDGICAVADEAGIRVVEDAAQAHGARYRGRPAGSFGVAATFSFYPGKNLGALGDGGAVVTDDTELAAAIRTLANHGRGSHLLHTHSGRNSRLDGIQAAALNVKLAHLDAWNGHRRLVHAAYRDRFEGSEVTMLTTLASGTPAHHLEVVRVPDRDGLRARLGRAGIATGIHYARPCHKHPAFARFDVRPLVVAETAARHQLSLPIHPTLTLDEVDYVADTVLEAL
ncbi:MAG: DegT/DnrJ/EryC1/StrS family aminotransferase [Acidimicrobiia bacterium]|nr:DegT/DnrJ/EryC1/StrS family aminotransferase [Acidimicrobiia bacterium]